MDEIDEVATTRSTPASFAAFNTLTVPFIAGSSICFCISSHPLSIN